MVFKRPLQQGNSKNKKLKNRVKNRRKNGKNRKKAFTKNKNSELVPVDRHCKHLKKFTLLKIYIVLKVKTTPEFEVPPNAQNGKDYNYEEEDYPQQTSKQKNAIKSLNI